MQTWYASPFLRRMLTMVVSYAVGVITNSSVSFAIKNTYLYYALSNVRGSLQDTITDIALPKLGGFFAPIVGAQLGTMTAIPVTLFMADMTTFAIKETARIIRDIFRTQVLGEEHPKFPPLWRDMACSVSSFAIGFFAKAYFCNYAMGYVAEALKCGLIMAAPLSGASLVVACMAPAIVVMAAPTVTFFIGDIIASVVSAGSYSAMDAVCSGLCFG